MLLKKGSKGSVVKALQAFLGIKADGDFGPATEKAVRGFQAENNLREDGQAGDNTLRAMTAKGLKFPATAATAALDNTKVVVPLPATGAGFTTYNRENGGTDQYGTEFTIETTKKVAADWIEIHPEVLLQIGDISRKGGGIFPPHASHRNGKDLDIRPIRKDNLMLPVEVSNPAYDSKRTEELVRLIRKSFPKAIIYLNDERLIKLGLTAFCKGHHNHLHVRFK